MPEVRIWVDAAWPIFFFEEDIRPGRSTRRDVTIQVSASDYARWVAVRAEYDELQAHLAEQLEE